MVTLRGPEWEEAVEPAGCRSSLTSLFVTYVGSWCSLKGSHPIWDFCLFYCELALRKSSFLFVLTSFFFFGPALDKECRNFRDSGSLSFEDGPLRFAPVNPKPLVLQPLVGVTVPVDPAPSLAGRGRPSPPVLLNNLFTDRM